jgi:hypothetical protein
VRYRRSGEEGQYTYEQVASVFEADNDRVSSPAVNNGRHGFQGN